MQRTTNPNSRPALRAGRQHENCCDRQVGSNLAELPDGGLDRPQLGGEGDLFVDARLK
jgi:hypothetical protein